MEYEVRFYYPSEQFNDIINKLRLISGLHEGSKTYEKTIQFNHSDSRYNFYSKEIDGRFRFRISSNDIEKKAKLSWKRRLPNTTETAVNKEEEKEVKIPFEDIDNFLFIIKNVMHFEVIESYERYRTVFVNEDIEISVDEYPFGIAVEVENLSKTKNPEKNVTGWVSKIGLDLNNAYRLSGDDKYQELCKEQNITIFSEVTFDKEMPKVR